MYRPDIRSEAPSYNDRLTSCVRTATKDDGSVQPSFTRVINHRFITKDTLISSTAVRYPGREIGRVISTGTGGALTERSETIKLTMAGRGRRRTEENERD